MGSVTPLISIIEEMKHSGCGKSEECASKKFNFLWVGTSGGPEKDFVEYRGVKFVDIYSGKLRRYFSFKNFIDPFFVLIGFFQSLFILLKFKPDIVLSAGSFVSVPVIFAAKVLRVPILIHQMDIRAGLANKIMSPFATKITVGFKKSLSDYPAKKTVWTGNPTRKDMKRASLSKIEKKDATDFFDLKDGLSTVLIIGGGTGALDINNLVYDCIDDLTKFCQVIHVTGKGKGGEVVINNSKYHPFEFLPEIYKAYTVSDLVVSRGGLGVLSELSSLGKPSILIPMPNSHQEDNVSVFKDVGGAIILNQKELSKDVFVKNIKSVLTDDNLRKKLSLNIKKLSKNNAAQEIVDTILKISQIK